MATGRENEWLAGIAAAEVVRRVFTTLKEANLPFQRVSTPQSDAMRMSEPAGFTCGAGAKLMRILGGD